MQTGLTLVGLAIAVMAIAVVLWSAAFPKSRVWPPRRYTKVTPLIVWTPTYALFGILIALGVLGWGDFGIPGWVRFGIGAPLIILGNIAVWSEVLKFGLAQTGGAQGALRTEGLYRVTRNPQYLADIGIIAGWSLLAAAPWTFVVAVPAIIVLIAAPFAEEHWLRERYGPAFDIYAACVPRFF